MRPPVVVDVSQLAAIVREEALITLSFVELARTAYEQAGLAPSQQVLELMARAEDAARSASDQARTLDEQVNGSALDNGMDLLSQHGPRASS